MNLMALVSELIALHQVMHVNKKRKEWLLDFTYLYCGLAVIIRLLIQVCYSEGNAAAKSAFGGHCSWCCLLSVGWVVGSLTNIVFLNSNQNYH